MNKLDDEFSVIKSKSRFITMNNETDKLIVYEKGDLLFVFNFHPFKSFEHYRIGTKWASEHKLILDTDMEQFNGKGLLSKAYSMNFPIIKEKWMNRPNYIQIYIPCRTAMVLIAEENISKYHINP